MKRKLIGVSILFLALMFAMVSCKSQPETTEETPTETTPPQTPVTEPSTPEPTPKLSQAAIDALNAAKQRAGTARQLSIDVDGPYYYPDLWKEAESQYILANNTTVAETDAAYNEAAGTYTGIALTFEAITEDSIPQFAEACRGRMLEARAMAINSGIVDLSPERFIIAEEYAVAAEAAWENEDYVVTIEAAQTALPHYLALGTAAEAYAVRMEIEDRGFGFFDQAALDAADDNAEVAVYQYDNGEIDAALDNARKALAGYRVVERKAWQTLATQEGNTAAGARKAAVDVRAQIAVKPEFDKADAVYKQAQEYFRTEEFRNANDSYTQSVSMFHTVRELAEYKRQQAQSAINAAEKKLTESEHTAEEAEAQLEGGAQ